jgi:hypothetical protein
MMYQDFPTFIPTTTSLQHEHPQKAAKVMKRPKSVQFADLPIIQIIENATVAYSQQELSDLYYTRQEVQRWRRLCKALAEDLSFYSDDELWDRFAVRSITQQHTRRQVRRALRCAVEGLNGNYALLRESQELNNKDDDSDEASCQSSLSHDSTLEEYFRISQACSQLAADRATRTAQEVMMVL